LHQILFISLVIEFLLDREYACFPEESKANCTAIRVKDLVGAGVSLDEDTKYNDLLPMKTTICSVICMTALGLVPAFCQEAPTPAVPAQPPRPPMPASAAVQPPAPTPGQSSFSERLQAVIKRASEPVPEPPLARFNLDFPGGMPKELVAAIEKAMGRPLNAIVPDEFANTMLPAVKMSSVNVSQLFSALSLASRKTETILNPSPGFPSGYGGYQTYQTAYGFKTEGTPADDSIWCFFIEKPVATPAPPAYKVCRFYSLNPYLDRGATVDDITTAIETGWKMLGEKSPPTISFHKDTKLLIAVGEPSKLETIDAVLKALEGPKPSPFIPGMTPMARPAAKPGEKP
jgi:hypothetical protein